MSVLEPGECSVISIINGAKKEFLAEGIQTLEQWQLCIVFPWNGLEHTLLSDLELISDVESDSEYQPSEPVSDSDISLVHSDSEGQHAHDFVHWYYSKEAFQITYSGVINPIPDASRWPATDGAPLNPPLRRTLVGRPKKNRRREPDEGPAAGRTFSNKCKRCRIIGHNKKT
ncbi:hypothetical protein Ddye_024945 [Dipteronia dyeriana]|uniref:Uncharacterized protein n=1 Tax=Dipteronia dyeriana TaxID=168575 RepID=A0AAD9TW99_9ROSI|nr:hypothetical protein Ddye_024945 [Dipteronia dyeriana]